MASYAYASSREAGSACGVAEQSCIPREPSRGPERAYADASLGFVLSGWFDYESEMGSATAAPGAVVCGNAGETFRCGHLGTPGNRRLVAAFDPDFLTEVANDCGLDEVRFPAAALPPGKPAARIYGLMRRVAANRPGSEEAAALLGLAALTADPADGEPERLSPRDQARVLSAIRHIENAYAEPCTLESLAQLAGLSRWHFLRCFRQGTGQTPTQYLIHARVRAAAERLLTTRAPVLEVALDVGFNDVSHFNACFRAILGCTPTRWRALA